MEFSGASRKVAISLYYKSCPLLRKPQFTTMPRQIDISKLIAGVFFVLPLIVIGLALHKYATVGVEGYLIVAGGGLYIVAPIHTG